MPIYEDRNINNLPAADLSGMGGGGFVGTDASGNAKKVNGNDLTPAQHLKVVSNPEYAYAVVDGNGVFLFGVKADGSFEFAKGVPGPVCAQLATLSAAISSLQSGKVDNVDGKGLVDSTFANGVSVVSNPEFAYAVVDADGKFLFGVKSDGSFEFAKGIPSLIRNFVESGLSEKQNAVQGKSLVDSIFADAQSNSENVEFCKILIDAAGKIILALNKKGQHEFFTKPKFNAGVDWSSENLTDLGKALKENGFNGGCGDWSDKDSVQIPKPNFAITNFSGVDEMPTSKTQNSRAVFEFWDCNGNYFKKNAVVNAQGNSSLLWVKKNVSLDLLNEDGSSFSIKIGDWVSQDSYHVKAFYTDYFRCVALVGYDFYKDILDTRDFEKDRAWKNGLLKNVGVNYGEGIGFGVKESDLERIDNGALCFPQGFPCAVYLNGSFYGVFAFCMKKHRDNYMMDKSSAKHIHIDGTLGSDFFVNGNIDWTAFEVRNPKKLICMDGTSYDGDSPKELIDETSQFYNADDKNHRNSKAVKESIVRLSLYATQVSNVSTDDEKKEVFERYFDVDNLIDYQVFSDACYNIDYVKNWQWTTWDGEKWFVNAYDLDMTFGANFTGDAIYVPATKKIAGGGSTSVYVPLKFIQRYYNSLLESRWSELRNNGVISVKNIVGKLISYTRNVGSDFYKKEWIKWPDSPCNRDMVVNSYYWSVKLNESGSPVIANSSSIPYNSSKVYDVGEECTYNPASGSFGWYYTFVCKASGSGNVPATKSGIRDSLWRFENWLKKTIENMDISYNYNKES